MRDLSNFVYTASVTMLIGIFFTLLDFAYGESDFVLEMNNASTNNEKLTLFAIEGQSYREICPSGQCTLDNEHLDPLFGPPTPVNMGMYGSFGFTLHDNVPNPNVGPIKKEFLEKFSASFGCKVDDIIEDNGQEIYICNNGTSTVSREFDYRTWDYDTIVIFDANKNTLRVVGNYTGSR
jgi:hypothetical protein